jgi:hypothetical protein
MCVCVFVDMYVCVYVCMYVHANVLLHDWLPSGAAGTVCVYVCLWICMYVFMHVCMYTPMLHSMHGSMHACMYICMYICIYIYTHIHILYVCMCVYTASPAHTITAVQFSLSNASACRCPIGNSIPRTLFLHLSPISSSLCTHASDKQRMHTSSKGPFMTHGGLTIHPPAEPHPGTSRHFHVRFPAGSEMFTADVENEFPLLSAWHLSQSDAILETPVCVCVCVGESVYKVTCFFSMANIY